MLYGDWCYRGCEGGIVCDSWDMRAKRQVVEGVISQIKLFNAGSGWRSLTCVLVYVYAYAIGYSYYRRGELEVYFLSQRISNIILPHACSFA